MIPHWHMSHVSLFLLVTQVLNIIAMKVLKQIGGEGGSPDGRAFERKILP